MAAWLDGTAPNTPPGFDKGWECVQEAGDIVFVPREWFHAVVNLDDERKAAMVSNLMVVLCGERDTQPVVNAGSLY